MNPSSTTSYRVIVLTGFDPDTGTHRLIMADSFGGLMDDFRFALMKDDPAASPVSVLFDFAHAAFMAAGEGTIIVDRVPLYVWDDGDDKAHLAEFVEKAKELGWTAGAGAELGSGWITWQKEGCAIVHMGIRRMMPADLDALISPIDDPLVVAERLSRYADLIGAPYRATPGVSGLAALRNLYDRPRPVKRPGKPIEWEPRRQPRWQWNHSGVLDVRLSGQGDLHWQRRPTPAEQALPFVVPFDVRAMYLAAAAQATLGYAAPRHTGAVMFDPTLAGFWRIYIGTGNDAYLWARPEFGPPIVNPNRIDRDGCTWVTTPILRYLGEAGEPMPDIIDSWLSESSADSDEPSSGRWLREWAEQIRDALPDARTAGDPLLRKHVKFTYVEALAMMGTAGGRVSRSDVTWTVRDEARIGVLRKVRKVDRLTHGVQPLKVKVDCVWYPSGTPDGLQMLAWFGQDPHEPAKIGQFKIVKEGCSTMREYLSRERHPSTVGGLS